MRRVALALGLGIVAMTISSLITDHALPPLLEVVTYLVVAFAVLGLMALRRTARHKPGR
ncbi:hypothetical protein N7U49_29195 [Streptomyces sp. AD2-2]|nr:hypothetical protein N7U49_29195 [Streptomyces sp. AD2-2]